MNDPWTFKLGVWASVFIIKRRDLFRDDFGDLSFALFDPNCLHDADTHALMSHLSG